MNIADIPTRFPIPWADAAIAPYVHEVPKDSQQSVTAGAASLTDGFPPANFTPISAGGTPPFGNDMNGILKQVTQWVRWFTAGGTAAFDSSFSTSIGGYPLGAIIPATIPGSFWISTVDGNTTNPDAGGAGWSAWGFGTGDVKTTMKATADYGWVMANDGTVGNASSNATTYANALAEAIFTLVWTNISNTYAALLTSAGAPVARGASAAADFAANRQITLTKALGRALIIAGAGSGLTNRALGQILGEEDHLLTIPEIPAHTHSLPYTINVASAVNGTGTDGTRSGPITSGSTGGGGSHNNMQPSSAWNLMIKL